VVKQWEEWWLTIEAADLLLGVKTHCRKRKKSSILRAFLSFRQNNINGPAKKRSANSRAKKRTVPFNTRER